MPSLKTHELPVREEPSHRGTRTGVGGVMGRVPAPSEWELPCKETCPRLPGGGKSPLLLFQPGLLHRRTRLS